VIAIFFSTSKPTMCVPISCVVMIDFVTFCAIPDFKGLRGEMSIGIVATYRPVCSEVGNEAD